MNTLLILLGIATFIIIIQIINIRCYKSIIDTYEELDEVQQEGIKLRDEIIKKQRKLINIYEAATDPISSFRNQSN